MSKTKSHVPPEVSAYMAANGHRGGSKTAERGSDYYKEISKRGLQARWGNHIKVKRDRRKHKPEAETPTTE